MACDPIHKRRPIRIICIGAGIAGLCFAYKLQRSFEDFTLTLYERNKGVAGVWLENTYPGCHCDFPAHNYTYSFEPNTGATQEYASSSQVRAYLEGFASKYKLYQYISFNSLVTATRWNTLDSKWELDVKNTESGMTIHDSCDILINASGIFSTIQWPKIDNLENFTGKVIHTALWPEGFSLDGKRVGLIGNGSTGQQVLAAVQPIAGKVIHFVRQANWTISPPTGPQRTYTAEEMQEFCDKSGLLLEKRKSFETFANSLWAVCIRNSEMQLGFRAMAEAGMQAGISDPVSREQLIPKYSVCCRRPVVGPGYLEALNAENVKIAFGDIKGIKDNIVIGSQGTEYELDVLICATGFDTSYVPAFSVIQRNGENLQDVWRRDVRSYMATAVAECPNYFTFCGPMNPFGSGPYLFAMETQADYMLKFCNRWQTENIASFVPKSDAVDDFMQHAREVLQSTVWVDECRSWYKKHTSDSTQLIAWPGSGLHFHEALSDPRWEDYEFSYGKTNRFAWLGNGFSQVEMDPEGDRAFYLRESDDSPPIARSKLNSLLRCRKIKVDPEPSQNDEEIPDKLEITPHNMESSASSGKIEAQSVLVAGSEVALV